MPAAFWIGISCGVALGGLVGYFIGYFMAMSHGSAAAKYVAAERVAEQKADVAHAKVEEKLRIELKKTESASDAELLDALNADFALPPDGVLSNPISPTGGRAVNLDITIKRAK